MKKEELNGKKVRGFRFDHKKLKRLQYIPKIMDNYIGKIGVIEEYNIIFDSYRVKFENGMSYHYPAELIEQHLVEEPTIEVNYNHISVRICEDNSLIGYFTEDCGITSFGKTFDELLRNLQHAKKAIEEAREKLAKEDLERFEKSLDQSAEEFINDANRNIIDKVDTEGMVNDFLKEVQKELNEIKEVRHKADNGVNISFDSRSSNDLKLESLEKEKLTYSEAAKKEERISNANITKSARLDKKDDIVEEPDEETKAKVERAMKALERGIANSKLNESCIDYGKIEQGYICPQTKQQCDDECCVSGENCHLKTSVALEKPEKTNPLDDLPIIGDGVLMEVSDTGFVWTERYVIGKTKSNFFIAWVNSEDIYCWKYCRPITPKTKITRKEFEQKFEIID
jgi:predicted RNase H-like HicB family nuclease